MLSIYSKQMKRKIYFRAMQRLLKKIIVQLIVLSSKVEVDGGFNFWTFFAAQLKGTTRMTDIPPSIATRKNTRGPFLFQCCRVVFNKERNRLELPKGEVVGKTVTCKEDQEEAEYENTAVSLVQDEESNLTG